MSSFNLVVTIKANQEEDFFDFLLVAVDGKRKWLNASSLFFLEEVNYVR